MTNITLTFKDKEISNIEISGHANQAEIGKDIVCASISLVTFGAINAIDSIKKSDVKLDKAKGYINIKINKLTKEDKIKMSMFISQLELIAKKYKKYVAIKKEKKIV